MTIRYLSLLSAVVIVMLGVGAGCTGCGRGGRPPVAVLATDENLKKLASGMALGEVEAIIGKGTKYSQLDPVKANFGLVLGDPGTRENTYVWCRSDDSAFVALFEMGKLKNTMMVLMPKKK